jgi:hypothetical protein
MENRLLAFICRADSRVLLEQEQLGTKSHSLTLSAFAELIGRHHWDLTLRLGGYGHLMSIFRPARVEKTSRTW